MDGLVRFNTCADRPDSVIICGIDEAGRGSFIGPMAIAGVTIKESDVPYLESEGVQDSKVLTPDTRERLYRIILDCALDYVICRVYPRTIDNSVLFHGLADLELDRMSKIVSAVQADHYYVDSCYADENLFGQKLAALSGCSSIHSHVRADSQFTVVAAASILAKVSRDRSVSHIQRQHPIGSGYPSDPTVREYVSAIYQTTGMFPVFVRQSWYTACRIAGRQQAKTPDPIESIKQSVLDQYIDD